MHELLVFEQYSSLYVRQSKNVESGYCRSGGRILRSRIVLLPVMNRTLRSGLWRLRVRANVKSLDCRIRLSRRTASPRQALYICRAASNLDNKTLSLAVATTRGSSVTNEGVVSAGVLGTSVLIVQS